jgi:hypothetical protein
MSVRIRPESYKYKLDFFDNSEIQGKARIIGRKVRLGGVGPVCTLCDTLE